MRLMMAVGTAALMAGCSDASRLSDPFSDPFTSGGSPKIASSRGIDRAPTGAIGAAPRVDQRPLPAQSASTPYRAPTPAPAPVASAAPIGGAGASHWTADGGTPVTVGQGESASVLATRFGVPTDALLRANGYSSAAQVQPGSRVIIPVYRAGAVAHSAPAAATPAKVAEARPDPKAEAAAAREEQRKAEAAAKVARDDQRKAEAAAKVAREEEAKAKKAEAATKDQELKRQKKAEAETAAQEARLARVEADKAAAQKAVEAKKLAEAKQIEAKKAAEMKVAEARIAADKAKLAKAEAAKAKIDTAKADVAKAEAAKAAEEARIARAEATKAAKAERLAKAQAAREQAIAEAPVEKTQPKVALADKPVDKSTPVGSIPPAEETTKAAIDSDKPEFRWPARGRVIQGFSSGGNDGINIAVPEGTPVKAAEGGQVAYAGSELKGYGNLVLIRHPNGFVTAYAHNGELDVKRGDTVKRGQTIAKSGQSGNVGSPQLHFELRKGSTPVDPTNYLAGL